MVSAAEEVHVACRPRAWGAILSLPRLQAQLLQTQCPGATSRGQTTHGLDKDVVKHWLVIKEGWRLGNNTPMRMQLGPVLDADRPRSNRPNDDAVEVMDEVVVMDDVPDSMPHTAATDDTHHRPLQRAGGARLRRGDEGLCQAMPHTEVLDNGIDFDTGTGGADTATQARQAVDAPVTWPRHEPQ